MSTIVRAHWVTGTMVRVLVFAGGTFAILNTPLQLDDDALGDALLVAAAYVCGAFLWGGIDGLRRRIPPLLLAVRWIVVSIATAIVGSLSNWWGHIGSDIGGFLEDLVSFATGLLAAIAAPAIIGAVIGMVLAELLHRKRIKPDKGSSP